MKGIDSKSTRQSDHLSLIKLSGNAISGTNTETEERETPLASLKLNKVIRPAPRMGKEATVNMLRLTSLTDFLSCSWLAVTFLFLLLRVSRPSPVGLSFSLVPSIYDYLLIPFILLPYLAVDIAGHNERASIPHAQILS